MNFLSKQIKKRIKQDKNKSVSIGCYGLLKVSESKGLDKSLSTQVGMSRMAIRRGPFTDDDSHHDAVLLVSEIPSYSLETGMGHIVF